MVRVLRLRPGHSPEVTEMENSLDALQRTGGGHIQIVKVGDRIDLVVNEDGAHDLLGNIDGHSITGVALSWQLPQACLLPSGHTACV